MDVYVLDDNLQPIGLIDSYNSLIWANRYNDIGDFELYINASVENFQLLTMGRYVTRFDDVDSMTCRIQKIVLDTNAEAGNYLTVTGSDTKSFLDQRIIWDMMNADGNVEGFIRDMIDKSCLNPVKAERKFLKGNGGNLIALGAAAGFSEVTTEQVTYKNVGEKTREYCKTNKWGYKFNFENETLKFELYKGADRSNEVIFSDEFENLSSTKYTDDATHMGNVALVGGTGEGSERKRSISGKAESVDRYEIFCDAKDISTQVSWEELTAVYPNGYIAISGNAYVYKMSELNIQVVDNEQLAKLKAEYPNGQEITIDGQTYYQVYDVAIATLETNTPAPEDTVELLDVVYDLYLLNRGYENLAEYGEKISFEGSIIPDVTFTYKKDYFLGDIVTVENEYGLKESARIVEIVEVNDESGYSVEPKFEYLNNESEGLS